MVSTTRTAPGAPLETLPGTLEGRSNALFATGAMRGTRTDWLGIHTETWRLDQMNGRLLPTPDLALPALHLADATFLGVHLDSAMAAHESPPATGGGARLASGG